MKTLTRIQALNFKGTTIDAELAPLTAIIGRNTGGKTAVANAITIAILGYLPALGKQANKTAQLMTPGAQQLDIRATFDAGGIANRSFKVNSRGAVSSKSEGVDLSDQVNACQLDFNEFRNAKPTDRQRILESLMAASADQGIFEDARAKIAKAALPIVLTFADGWLTGLEATAKETARMLKQEIDTAAKTILQLSSEDRPATFDAAAAAELTAKLSELRTSQGQAQEAFDELARRQMQAPERPEGEPVTRGDVELLENEIVARRQELDGLIEGWKHYRDEWTRAENIRRPHEGVLPEEATSEPMTRDELTTATRRLNERKSDALSAKSAAKTKLESAIAAAATAKKRRDTLTSTECCPTCGIAGKVFAEAIDELTSGEVDRAQSAIEEATTLVEEAAADWVEIEESEKMLADELLKAMRHAAWEAARDADAIMKAADAGKPAKTADSVLQEVNEMEARRRAQARAAVEWDAFNGANIPTDQQVEAARVKWDGIRRQVADLVEKQAQMMAVSDRWNQYLADQARLAELTNENTTREGAMIAARDLAGWAKQQSLEVTAAAMKPLLDVCNVILAEVVRGEIAIDGTSVGIVRGDFQFFPLEVLSGSEAAAFAAAMQVAIAGKSALRLVIVDELSTFEPQRKTQFIANLFSAIKLGLVDQVVVIDHDTATGHYTENLGGQMVEVID